MLVLLVKGVWRCLVSVEQTTRVLCFFSMYNRQPLGTQEGSNKRHEGLGT